MSIYFYKFQLKSCGCLWSIPNVSPKHFLVIHCLEKQIFLPNAINWARNYCQNEQHKYSVYILKSRPTKGFIVREKHRHLIKPYRYDHLKGYWINIFPYSYLHDANQYNSNHKSLCMLILTDFLIAVCVDLFAVLGLIQTLSARTNPCYTNFRRMHKMTNIKMNSSSANKAELRVCFTAHSITRGFVYLGFHNWNHILGSSRQSKLC